MPFFLEYYLLANEEWKYDKIPEIVDGKNIADFIDPDIMEVGMFWVITAWLFIGV